jgi:diguanylate cyclase (GGDEF)-like protein
MLHAVGSAGKSGSRLRRAGELSMNTPGLDLATKLRLFQRALRSRIERRDALLDIVRVVNATLEPPKIAEQLVDRAASWIPAPCWVVIAHDVNGHLNVLADVGLVPNLGPSLWSAANWVMRHNAEFFSGDLAKDSRGGPGANGSAIALPLTCRNRSVGALVCLDPQPSRSAPSMGPSLVVSLRLLLEPSAIALDNALALQRAEALSVTDELTRLSNSRYLNQVLRRETKRSVRNGSPLSLLFLDLDTFKSVNDQHGHLAGSKVLMEAAAVIRGCARETDVVARFGGDEFTLLLPDTNTEGAVQVAERIRDRLRASRFLASDGLSVRQTVSIGVATLEADKPRTADELMRAADMAMYRVKAAGKDGIHVAQDGS